MRPLHQKKVSVYEICWLITIIPPNELPSDRTLMNASMDDFFEKRPFLRRAS